MYVKDLTDYDGMIFVYDHDDYHSVWMKNTYISLDVLFLDSNFTIIDIYCKTTPLSLNSIKSKKKSRFIVELREGMVFSNNLKVGDKFVFDIV